MSSVSYIRRPNRLGKLISAPGGRKLSEAVAKAEANLEVLRPGMMNEVDGALERLRDAAARSDMAARSDVYNCATAIVSFAGLCGMKRLGEVAYNLCELSDRYIEAGVWNAAAIGAHALPSYAARAGLRVAETWALDGRTFAALQPR